MVNLDLLGGMADLSAVAVVRVQRAQSRAAAGMLRALMDVQRCGWSAGETEALLVSQLEVRGAGGRSSGLAAAARRELADRATELVAARRADPSACEVAPMGSRAGRAMVIEVARLLSMSEGQAQVQLQLAADLARLPRTFLALADGSLPLAHATVLARLLGPVELALGWAVEDAVLSQVLRSPDTGTSGPADPDGPDAAEGWTPLVGCTSRELGRLVERWLLAADPAAARDRADRAGETADVVVLPDRDGMGTVCAFLPATGALSAMAAVDARAEALRRAGDARPVGLRRAEAFLAALTGGPVAVQITLEVPVHDGGDDLASLAPGASSEATQGWQARPLSIRMPVACALGLTDSPAHLAGYGPIGVDVARALLPSAELLRLLVDERTGLPLSIETATETARALQAARRGAPGRTFRRAGRLAPGATTSTSGADLAHATGGVAVAPESAVTGPSYRTGDRDLLAGREWAQRRRPRELHQLLTDLAAAPGLQVDLGVDTYAIPEPLHRLVELRDRTCVFPGCARAAEHCDTDHRTAWPVGPTSIGNLDAVCRFHHQAKQRGWHRVLLPDGTHAWTSPRGRTYLRPPAWEPPPALPDRLVRGPAEPPDPDEPDDC